MAELLLGPVLRRVGTEDAVLWVETDAACHVAVQVGGAGTGHGADTFHVEGHHYALVHVEGLTPGTTNPYEVALDGERCWPPADSDLPDPVICTWEVGRPFRLLFGSCHQAAPEREPYDVPRSDDKRGLGPDALVAYALAIVEGSQQRPDALLLVGDQVYADETHPEVEAVLEARRGRPPEPGWPQVASFEEYTWLYQQSWSPRTIRWLFSTVPVAMIFDDHDIIDDWNTSATWREQIQREPWWEGRIHGGLMSYWLYQHLGNVAADEELDRELLEEVQGADDEGAVLRAFAERADAGTAASQGHRWSYRLDLGPCRVVVIDTRNGRVLEEGARGMVDEDEWAWVDEQLTGDVDHLVVGSSLPWLLPPALHALEAWDEEVTAGAWGRWFRPVGERIRQGVDLEHWAAFGRSFRALATSLTAVARGERGRPPATIVVLSGDVHFAYVAEPRWERATSRVRQVVSSPLRQGVPPFEQRLLRLGQRPPLTFIPRGLARLAPRTRTDFTWSVTDGPWFDNNVALLTFGDGAGGGDGAADGDSGAAGGGAARLQLFGATLDEDTDHPGLDVLLDRPL